MTSAWMTSPWVVYWLSVGMFFPLSWILSAQLAELLGAWIFLLPAAIALFCLVALVHAVAVTARESKLNAVGAAIAGVVVPTLLLTILVPIRSDPMPRARLAKAEADIRQINAAVGRYSAHMGRLPMSLNLLTESSRNAEGKIVDAFLREIPTPPKGWSPAYRYTTMADGTFSISVEGEGRTVRGP